MKVKYVGDYYKVSLKKGKTYSVLDEVDGMYVLNDESGEAYGFPKDDFEIVQE